LKKGWSLKAWAEVLDIQSGRNQKEVADPEGAYPILGSAGKVMGYANKFLCERNTTIIGRKGTIDRPLYIQTRFWNVDTAFGLLAGPNLHKKYLYYFCLGYDFQKHDKGTTLPSLVKKDLVLIEIPVPPLGEQEEIVEVLDKAFSAIDQAKANIEQNIANAEELFQSKLNQIFSQKGEGWAEMSLSETLETQPRNGWSPPAAHHSDSGTPVLTLSAVTGFEFHKDKVKYTSVETDSGRHYWVNNGDLLITRSNTPKLVGHVAIVGGIEEPTIYPDLIMRMVPQASLVETEFLYYQLRAPELRKIIMGRASGANPTMKKLNKAAVQTLPVSMPAVGQQKLIAKELEELSNKTQELESRYQTKLNGLEELKKSILQKAFAGELT